MYIYVYICNTRIYFLKTLQLNKGVPGGSVVEKPLPNAGDSGDMGSITGSGQYPRIQNANLFQYSCLENSTHRGAWRATVHGVAKSQTQLSD